MQIRRYYNHNLEEEYFQIDDKKQGLALMYFESGQIMNIVSYSKDIKNGEFKEFHENGKLRKQGYYQDDIKVGDWCYYNENGTQIKCENFDKKTDL